MTIRVAILHESPFIGHGLFDLLSQTRDIRITASVSRLSSLMSLPPKSYDVVLIGGWERDQPTAARLWQEHQRLTTRGSQPTPLVCLVSHSAALTVRQLDASGVAVLPTSCELDELLEAIRTVANGGMWGGHAKAPTDHRAVADLPVRNLAFTKRESQVLALLVVGRSTEQIAAELNIAINTVRVHIQHVLTKTGTTNRVQATAYALEHALT